MVLSISNDSAVFLFIEEKLIYVDHVVKYKANLDNSFNKIDIICQNMI